MGMQLFGTIQTATGDAHTMVCVDRDQSTDLLFHVWGKGIRPSAVLMSGTMQGGIYNLHPTVVFRVNPDGHIHAPKESELDENEKEFKAKVTVELRRSDDGLLGTWLAPDGVTRSITLDIRPNPTSLDPQNCANWADFKNWVDTIRKNKGCTAFRGHGSNQFSLETTLSRVGRYRIERYCRDELRTFAMLAEATLGVKFDMENKDDFATVVGLAQHHGLPTPLLDWTASPYVAAFFAFSDAIEMGPGRKDVTHVRVYALAGEFLSKNSPPVIYVNGLQPYVHGLAIPPRHNPRLLAQQGMFLVTNMSNIEAFIQFKESEVQSQFLYAADIPIASAAEALEDLAFMGLTAATMYQGLDGVGRTIRHQMLFQSAKALALQTS